MYIIHLGALIPPSVEPVRTLCGRFLPFDAKHLAIWGVKQPRPSRLCKCCKTIRSIRNAK